MKKLFIFAILGSMLLFLNCGPKEKKETTETPKDSIVTETVIVDTVAKTEIIKEDSIIENTPLDKKSTTVTKITTKKPGKVVIQKTTETKVGGDTKVVVETKVVVAEPPKKVVVTEAPVKVVVAEQPKKVIVVEAPVKAPVKVTVQTPKGKAWNVPAADANKKSPIKADAAAISSGKSLWGTNCKSCHGVKGLGDGPKAEKIDISCGDFSSNAIQSLTDGELFYKTTVGRKPMPSYKDKLSDTDRWQLVAFMRTLKK